MSAVFWHRFSLRDLQWHLFFYIFNLKVTSSKKILKEADENEFIQQIGIKVGQILKEKLELPKEVNENDLVQKIENSFSKILDEKLA